jgi:hypothetical protein
VFVVVLTFEKGLPLTITDIVPALIDVDGVNKRNWYSVEPVPINKE